MVGIFACMPPLVWMLCVVLFMTTLYLWMIVAPESGENFGLVFFGGLVITVIAAAIAKGYQRPEPK